MPNLEIWQSVGLFGWSCRIHWLHLCREVRLPQRMSRICHYTMWWWGSSNAGALENEEYPFITIALKSTLFRSGITCSGPIYGSNKKLNCVLMLNWIAWNRTVWKFNWVETKNYTYTELNCLKCYRLYV